MTTRTKVRAHNLKAVADTDVSMSSATSNFGRAGGPR